MPAQKSTNASTSSKAGEFDVISSFNLGYRNREDKTNLPPQTLITGSQNVLTNVYGRISSRKGYTIDGLADTSISSILASYDHEMHTGDIRNLRAGFLTSSADDGKLQFRFVHTDGTIEWIDLLSDLTSTRFNFCDYWDTTAIQSRVLWVNGASEITEWTGGVTTFASATANTITKEGTETWAEVGFYPTGTHKVVMDGVEYTATGGWGTTTLTGVTPDPSETSASSSVSSSESLSVSSSLSGSPSASLSPSRSISSSPSSSASPSRSISSSPSSSASPSRSISSSVSSSLSPSSSTSPSPAFSPSTSVSSSLSSSPSAAPTHEVGTVIHQLPETTLNSAMTSLPSIGNDLIANLRNQIYVASFTNQGVYVSDVNNYKDYSFTSPTRVVGEGAILTLDGIPVALVPREDQMNISAGKDQWYKTQFTLSADLTTEELTVVRLKTTSDQATQSQALTSKFKNNVVFISNEPILESLGWVDNVFGEPQLTDISFPIVNDFNTLDFTDGEVRYHKNFVYVSCPKASKVFVYNMTNPDNKYWEAPQILPVGRFSVIDGNLYGHSYLSSETYKLFDGYDDNGNFINAVANMAFNSHGMRHCSKGFNQYFVEGYISSNTTLTLGLQYDIDGCATVTEFDILGNDTRVVCIGTDYNLIGKNALGKKPLGGDMAINQIIPKFRIVKTFPKVPYYEYQVSFQSSGKDQQWEVLAFGPAWSRTFEGNCSITL